MCLPEHAKYPAWNTYQPVWSTEFRVCPRAAGCFCPGLQPESEESHSEGSTCSETEIWPMAPKWEQSELSEGKLRKQRNICRQSFAKISCFSGFSWLNTLNYVRCASFRISLRSSSLNIKSVSWPRFHHELWEHEYLMTIFIKFFIAKLSQIRYPHSFNSQVHVTIRLICIYFYSSPSTLGETSETEKSFKPP